MAFSHSPASTISTPDTFTDERIDVVYEVSQDLDAEDPRTWIDDAHAAVYTYHGPRGHRDEVPDNRVAEAFAHFYERFGDDETALRATERWLGVFHPDVAAIVDVAIATVHGYSQGDWRDVFAVVTEGYGTAADHIDQFRQWAFGDVWTVEAFPGESLGGIYADDAEEALQQFIAQFPPAYEHLVFDNALAAAVADALKDRGDEAAARWVHADEQRLWGEDPDVNIGMLLDRIQNRVASGGDRNEPPVLPYSVNLDADSVRGEIQDAYLHADNPREHTAEELRALLALDDRTIGDAISATVDDSFWCAFDSIRSDVISRLARELADAPE